MIVWVYKVRTTDVRSKGKFSENMDVAKSSNGKKPSSNEHHDLVLTFKDNKLVNWESKFEEIGEYSIKLEKDGSINEITSKTPGFTTNQEATTSSSWSFDVYLSSMEEEASIYDGWDSYSASDSGTRLGLIFSKPMWGMNAGFDLSFGYGTGMMLFLEKEFFGFDFVYSLGTDESDSDNGESTSKIGIFRDFSIAGVPLSFGIEKMTFLYWLGFRFHVSCLFSCVL